MEDKLEYESKHIGKARPEDIARAQEFCEGYKQFLDAGKTERECVCEIRRMAEAGGYTAFDPKASYQPGDRIFFVNRGKNIFLATIGTKALEEGIRFNIAHIDSPRLDLKPLPLYEKDGLALLKTHYYGGVRKYQWSVTPLAMHGVVMLKDGTKVELAIGEKEGEPQFVISDLLPHLAAKQNERPLKEGIRGEELNVILGSLPCSEEDSNEIKNAVKMTALKILYETYGITETDFMRAEIEMVPAVKAADIGLDRSLIGAYGQDDRVCAYAAVKAAFVEKDPEYTCITVCTDKEEIGSAGNTGMASSALTDFVEDLCDMFGAKKRNVLRNSFCISSDVNAALDPTFDDVFDRTNSCRLGHGPVLTKYTGARGKGGSNDASAETMFKIIKMMDDAGVCWQTGEMGKVDEGGGGTIARFMGDQDVDTVDFGVPVLSMHAPFEQTSKLDVYHTWLAFRAFIRG